MSGDTNDTGFTPAQTRNQRRQQQRQARRAARNQDKQPDGRTETLTHSPLPPPNVKSTTRCHLFFFKEGAAVPFKTAFPDSTPGSVIVKHLLSYGYFSIQVTDTYVDLQSSEHLCPFAFRNRTRHPVGKGFRMIIGDATVALIPTASEGHHTAQLKCNLIKPHGRSGYSLEQQDTHCEWIRQATRLLPSSVWAPTPGGPPPYVDNGGSVCATFSFKSASNLPTDAKLALPDNLQHRFVGNGLVMYAHITTRRPSSYAAPPPFSHHDACRLPIGPQAISTSPPEMIATMAPQGETPASPAKTVSTAPQGETPALPPPPAEGDLVPSRDGVEIAPDARPFPPSQELEPPERSPEQEGRKEPPVLAAHDPIIATVSHAETSSAPSLVTAGKRTRVADPDHDEASPGEEAPPGGKKSKPAAVLWSQMLPNSNVPTAAPAPADVTMSSNDSPIRC